MILAFLGFHQNIINVDFGNCSNKIIKLHSSHVETEEHYDILVSAEGSRTLKSCSINFSLGYQNLIIASLAIHKGLNLLIGRNINQQIENWHQIFIFQCSQIQIVKVDANLKCAIFLYAQHNVHQPFHIPSHPNKANIQQTNKFIFDAKLDFNREFAPSWRNGYNLYLS